MPDALPSAAPPAFVLNERLAGGRAAAATTTNGDLIH